MSQENEFTAIHSVAPEMPAPESSARMHFPGSRLEQRPRIVRKDSDLAAPVINVMGSDGYNYAAPRNKKRM